MSILLDAVTRGKQQSQAITHDVVLTPRAQYREKQTSNGLRYAIIFVCSLLLMVLAAWLLSRVLYPVDGEEVQASSTSANGDTVIAKQGLLQSQSQPQLNNGEPTSDIRLAGKVALPVAQPFEAQARPITPRNVLSPNQSQGMSMTSQPQSNDLVAALLSAQQRVEQNTQVVTQASAELSGADEPIILGANSNKRGDELLASLKYQVENAANDVGLERGEPEKKNNLLAAFEAALKDVERNNSVATSVTEEKLDPIPTTPKSDDIPKYGQLPAGLQLQVPEFNISAHVYSSVADNRWLNVDGAELQEGDSIQGKLTIVEIRPRDVVLAIQGTEFKVPAI